MKVLRGRLLSFHRRPVAVDDTEAWTYISDGALAMEEGKIVYFGTAAGAPAGDVAHHGDKLILPGFIDAHLHFPQTQVTASYAPDLLTWLNTHTFPAETEFGDLNHARAVARVFFDLLILNGTTTPVAFCTSHPQSVDAYAGEATARRMRAYGGKTCMDRNAPADLCDTPSRAYDESAALLGKWHGHGRFGYVITPRFAITSSAEQLEALGALAAEHPDLHIQTHLSENLEEVRQTRALFPQAMDYLDVYDRFGLIRPGSLLGHAIHLGEREYARIAETGAVAVHCPTSNLFLGSGLFDFSKFADHGCKTAVSTDIGGGTSWSMLKTLDEAYKIAQLLGKETPNPFKAFWWATLGNADALDVSDKIGTLEVGSEADVIVLDPGATPAMQARHARAESLADELFLLQTLGDDRAVAEVYISGQKAKSIIR